MRSLTVFAINSNTWLQLDPQVGTNKQKSFTYLLLSELHLPGGDVREPPGGGAGGHEEALPGKEEVPRFDGHLSGRLFHYHWL